VLSKVLCVGRTEYLNHVRSKAFIIGIIMMPIMMGAGAIASLIAEENVDLTERNFAVVDHTGVLYETLVEAAESRNRDEVFDREAEGEPQVRPRFVVEPPVASGDGGGGEGDGDASGTFLELSDRVRRGELFAFLVIGENALSPDATEDNEVVYYTETPTYDELPRWINGVVRSRVQELRFEEVELDGELIAKVTRPVPFTKKGVFSVGATGEVVEGEEADEIRNQVVPMLTMIMMFMLVMMSAPAGLNAVLEEKMQKISEVLVSAVSPFQLMMGKLLGTVLVSITLSALYLGGVFWASHHFGFESKIPLALYGWFLFFQVLALLIFSALFSAIGAACSEMRDAQSLMTPAMILVMIPFFFFILVMESPNGTASTVISLFPPATPMLMLMRIAIPPGPPAWQVVLAVALTLAFTAFAVWAAGRVFRIGLLSTGQAPGFRTLVGWVFKNA